MAIFRKVHTSFWSDTFIQDLSIDQRYFYLYLLTNEQTKQCGVYEISKKQISFDTGYSMDKVSNLLKFFISKGKIRYSEDTKELAMGKWLKYNNSTSPKIKSCIDKEFEQVKDRVLIEYVYSMDTTSQEEEEQEQEEEQEEDLLIFENIDKSTWLKWTKYKSSQFKFKYKSKESEQTAINSLIELSGNSGLTALRIIDQSISNGWSGLFELKKSPTNTPQTQTISKNEQRFNKFQEAADGAAAIIRAKYGIEEDS